MAFTETTASKLSVGDWLENPRQPAIKKKVTRINKSPTGILVNVQFDHSRKWDCFRRDSVVHLMHPQPTVDETQAA